MIDEANLRWDGDALATPRLPTPPVSDESAIGQLPFNPAFLIKVEELELSVRSANCLKNDNIAYVGDLVQKTEAEMLRTPNFGRKALNEIKEMLAEMGLHLGLEVPDWPPENINQLAEAYAARREAA
jgi:DNA-directed RNA polymerase subunit alpha